MEYFSLQAGQTALSTVTVYLCQSGFIFICYTFYDIALSNSSSSSRQTGLGLGSSFKFIQRFHHHSGSIVHRPYFNQHFFSTPRSMQSLTCIYNLLTQNHFGQLGVPWSSLVLHLGLSAFFLLFALLAKCWLATRGHRDLKKRPDIDFLKVSRQ